LLVAEGIINKDTLKRRKIPARKCIACGEMKNKNELVRIVRQPDGSVGIDAGGKVSGRGAYVCKKQECIALAKKRKSLERNLSINDCEGIYTSLLEVCQEDANNG